MSKVKFGKSIKTQMLISFFFIVLLMVLTSAASIIHVRKVYQAGNKIYTTNLQTEDYLNSLNINVRRIDKFLEQVLDYEDNESFEETKAVIEDIFQDNTELMYKYENLEYSKEEKQAYDKCRSSLVDFSKDVRTVLDLLDAGKDDEARELYEGELLTNENHTFELLEEVAMIATESAKQSDSENYDSYRKVVMAIVITMILTTVLAVLVAIRVSNSFTGKLSVIQRWAKRVSEYNVSEDIADMGTDEFGVTTKALNDSQFMIRDLVEKIMEESAVISDSGKEVSDSVRKTKKRIDDMNLAILESSNIEKEFIKKLINTMLENSISNEVLEKMRELLDIVEKSTEEQDAFCKELSSMATYMEQIAITSDYQNKMAESHREQVGKFKVKKDI